MVVLPMVDSSAQNDKHINRKGLKSPFLTPKTITISILAIQKA